MRMENGSGGYRERFVRSFLDWLVLSILRDRPAYGHEMIRAIEEEFQIFLSPGSLYPTLRTLERSGFVKGMWDQPDARSKKVYELTPDGIQAHRDGFDSIGRILALHAHLSGKAGP